MIKFKTWICLLLTVMVGGCSLEEKPMSDATPDMLYATPTGIRDGVNGIYSLLRELYGSQRGFTLTTFGTDLFMHGKDGGYKAMDLYSTELDPSLSYLAEVWNFCYKGINGANTVLERVESVDINENLKNRYRAEARFLRAHFYYWLTLQFGDVVWSDRETKGVITDAGRTDKREIWQRMKEDSEFAVSVLDWNTEDYGRATKGAALHQLATVSLLLDDASGAAQAAERVINEGPYTLLASYADIFDYNNQENREIVFAVQYTRTVLNNGSGNQGHAFFTPAYDQFAGLARDVNQGGRPYARFRPTSFFINLFEADDSRFDVTFRRHWFYNNRNTLPAGKALGDTVIWEIAPGVASTTAPNVVNMHWAIKKHDDATRASVQDLEGFRDFFVFRLAETYLLAAEAHVRGGNMEQAAEYVNRVRQRAAKVGAALQIVQAADMDMDVILDERARELGGEGKRWMDLVRTNKLVERVREHNTNARANVQTHHAVRPIPQQQIDLSTNNFPQNEGYR